MGTEAAIAIALCYLTASLALSQAGCPSKCVCLAGNVTCSEKYLNSVPNFESLPEAPLAIDLSGNEIEYVQVDDFSFESNAKVQHLLLNSNSIFDVDPGAFVELRGLHYLSLANNILENIPDGVVAGNPKLRVLALSNNIFGRSPPRLNSTSLEVLDLSFSKIETFNRSNVAGLPALKVLLLQDNNLRSLDADLFATARHLMYVNLAANTWRCDCKTVELFEFLVNASLTEVGKQTPVTCVTGRKTYIQIFTNEGALPDIKSKCKDKKWDGDGDLPGNQSLSQQNGMMLMQEIGDDIDTIEQLLELYEDEGDYDLKESPRQRQSTRVYNQSATDALLREDALFTKQLLAVYFLVLCLMLALCLGVLIGFLAARAKNAQQERNRRHYAVTGLDQMPYTLIVNK